MTGISNSELSTFLQCRRKWMLKYVMWLDLPPETEPSTGNRQLGLRIHQAFEADIKSGGQYGPRHWLDQIYGADMLAHIGDAEEIRKEYDLAGIMIDGYVEWAAETGLDEDAEVVSAETDVQAEMPGMPGIIIRGRLDQVIRRRSDGVRLFRDWKTVGSLSTANLLPLQQQMRFYAMLHRLVTPEGEHVDGGQVVYLLRSKRTARATGPFYQLEEVRYNHHDLNSIYARAYGIISNMMAVRSHVEGSTDEVSHLTWAYPSPDASCSWSCPFVHMCPLMDDGSRWREMAELEFTHVDPYAYYDRELPQ